MRELFVTGLQSASLYGAEVTGVDPAQLKEARTSYLNLVGSPATSSSTSLTLALAGDPLWRQGLGPALTWSSIVWKSATSSAFQQVMPLPQLGRLAGPAIQRLPRNWGAVRGPLGAAHLSLARVGWAFETPFTLRSPSGEIVPLTSTSPAMLAYHLQRDWKKEVEEQASKAIGLQGCQIDPSCYRAAMGGSRLSSRDRALLRAFMCHAVWSNQRLYDVGYQVSTRCPLCGGPTDALGHRLFECTGTQTLRNELLHDTDLDFIRYSASVRALAAGVQIMPQQLEDGRSGIGNEQYESWSLTGAPLDEVFIGDVFTDGSCSREGPPSWWRTGWSIVKLSAEGVLLGYARGTVGSRLPQSSAAAEHVPVLALACIASAPVVALSDYQGLEALEEKDMDIITYRKSMYGGVKLQIRGRAPAGFKVKKVKGHVDPLSCTSQEDARLALGNQTADEHARIALSTQTQSPTMSEMGRWLSESQFLYRYLQLIPRVLALFPAVSPTAGKKSLPKREGFTSRTGLASFMADVLSGLGAPSTDAGASSSSQPYAAPAAGPPERQERASPEGAARHDWHWRSGRWLCTSCLASSRLPVPPRGGKCPGMASNLARLVQNPRGHTLQIATYADGKGVVVVCSRCGHYSTTNRPAELHKKDCKAKQGQASFASPGARISYERIAAGKHPKHAMGEAKILDPCMSLAALRAAARAAEG